MTTTIERRVLIADFESDIREGVSCWLKAAAFELLTAAVQTVSEKT